MVHDCFGYPGFFAFPNEIEYRSFEVFEEFCWDFDGPHLCFDVNVYSCATTALGFGTAAEQICNLEQ
ncbi:hypothetical protein U0070_010238 [Myodes glareolus]|uniref:Uncharacterized protein n=1 Tax=Myodes glareolus TaxID=447135 RepID=A0AAW0H834_MYOGA